MESNKFFFFRGSIGNLTKRAPTGSKFQIGV